MTLRLSTLTSRPLRTARQWYDRKRRSDPEGVDCALRSDGGEQVLDAVEDRPARGWPARIAVTLAGERIGAAATPGDEKARQAEAEKREAQARLEAMKLWLGGEAEAERSGRSGWRPVTGRQLLTGSSFTLTAEAGEAGGGFASVWGLGARSRAFGAVPARSRWASEVTNLLVGADWTARRLDHRAITVPCPRHGRLPWRHRGRNIGNADRALSLRPLFRSTSG